MADAESCASLKECLFIGVFATVLFSPVLVVLALVNWLACLLAVRLVPLRYRLVCMGFGWFWGMTTALTFFDIFEEIGVHDRLTVAIVGGGLGVIAGWGLFPCYQARAHGDTQAPARSLNELTVKNS
ncbi:MAG: hypothetical protein ACFB20_01375 [Opitutales bacterium]